MVLLQKGTFLDAVLFSLYLKGLSGFVLRGAKILTQETVEEMALATDRPSFVLVKPQEGTGRLLALE